MAVKNESLRRRLPARANRLSREGIRVLRAMRLTSWAQRPCDGEGRSRSCPAHKARDRERRRLGNTDGEVGQAAVIKATARCECDVKILPDAVRTRKGSEKRRATLGSDVAREGARRNATYYDILYPVRTHNHEALECQRGDGAGGEDTAADMALHPRGGGAVGEV